MAIASRCAELYDTNVAERVSLTVLLGLLLATHSLHLETARAAPRKPAKSARRAGHQSGSNTPSEGTTRVAVVELTALGASAASGISNELMRQLEMFLRQNIAMLDGLQVIPAVDLQIALQDPANRKVGKCPGGPRCAAAQGRLVGADAVVYGAVGALGQQYSLVLRAIDARTGKELGREQTNISGDRNRLLYEVKVAAVRLMAPEQLRGSLVVDIDTDGVEVEIDGKLVGMTPLERPVENLKPGPHVVVLRRDGYSEFQKEFTITPFETAYVELELAKAQKRQEGGSQP